MSAHTPGPWGVYSVLKHSGPKGGPGSVRDIATGGKVARVHSRTEDTMAQEANARLIASAPDLLEALKRVGCQDAGSCPDPVDGPCFVCAAIAKATGGDR